MSEQQHTPGPWRQVGREIWAGNELVGRSTADPDDAGTFGRKIADAVLMAAAPDLLAALRGMVGLVQLIEAREPELKTNHRFVDALAAIAKAEGKDVTP